eukprot:2174608-Pyramimonas_sp.AAC.1
MTSSRIALQKVVEKIVGKLEISKTRAAQPQGKLKVPLPYVSERYPKRVGDTLVIAEPRGRYVTRKWTNAELQYACHLEPEEDDT